MLLLIITTIILTYITIKTILIKYITKINNNNYYYYKINTIIIK